MKLLNILLVLIFSLNAFAVRSIIGEEIVNSSNGTSIFNVPTAPLTTGSVPFINGLNIVQDNTNLFFDDTNNFLKIKNSIQLGSVDPFSRTQVWNYGANAVLRLGSLGQDGDPTDVSSEGSVMYGPNSQGTAINSGTGDFGYARVKADRFGLYTSIANTAFYYWRVDPTEMYLKNDSNVKTFNITRSTGLVNLPNLTASKLVKTNASKDLVSYDLVSGDITTALGFTPENVANKATDFTTVNDTLYPSVEAVSEFVDTAQSGTADTFAGFDGSGDLYSLPDWSFDTYTNGVTSDTQTDGSVQVSKSRLYFGMSLGDGVSGSLTNYTDLDFNTDTNANFALDNYKGLRNSFNLINGSTVDNALMIDQFFGGDLATTFGGLNVNYTGDAGGNVTLVNGYHGGDTAAGYLGVRVEKNGQSASASGFTSVIQGIVTGQAEQFSASNSADIGGNFFVLNSNNTGDVTDGLTVVNSSNSGTVDFFQGTNIQNSGVITDYLNMFGASNSGNVTNGINLGVLTNSGTATSFTGINTTNSGDITNGSFLFAGSNSGDNDNFQGVSLSNSGVSTSYLGGLYYGDTSVSPLADMQAINLNLTGTYDSVVGINVDVSSSTSSQRKVALNGQGGAINGFNPFTTTSSLPAVVDSGNGIITVFSVESGSPITDTSVLANNLSGLASFDDDYDGDPFFNLGYAMVGFTGQVSIATGKTADKISMAVGGASIPATSGTGTATTANIFNSRGLFSGGGTINIGTLNHFVAEDGGCTMATDCYGISIEDTTTDNYLAKSLKIGSTKGVLNSSTILHLADKKALLFTPMTTAEKNALTAVESMLVYDDTLTSFEYYDGSNWQSVASEAYVGAAISGLAVGKTYSHENANFNAACNKVHLVNASVNAQLPAPVADCEIEIKSRGVFTITVLQNGSEDIDEDAASFIIDSEKDAKRFYSDGTDWFVI